MMEKVKVFLSDPQVLFREGIHFILSGEDDFEVIGETTSNQEAFTLIEANPPNIAILSMQDIKSSGAEITRHIKRNLPSVSVILTLDKKEDEKLFAAMKSGASVCITKDTDPEYLLDVIRVVTQGSQPIIEELLIPSLAAMALTDFEDLAALNEQLDNLLAGLAPKENQILTNIAAGNNIEQVAAKLDITEETIRRNLRLVLNKLVSNEQARAVIEATQRSLPSIIGTGKRAGKSTEYVTKAEFNEFKESLMERLKSFIGELA
ncbi:MAG TPA: response regulator transcription factor [Dehalococcoidales bacterium]|nr:response regulator transcription factor [Dehalococcoidales bacterium]